MIPSFQAPWLQLLAWTLLHFLWQGALLGLAARGSLWLLRRRSPQLRYLVACAFLALMAFAPVATFTVLRPSAPPGLYSVETASEAQALPASAPERLSLRTTLQPALPWAVALWMGGVTLLSLRLLGGWLWLLRLRTRLAEPAGACWQMGLDALARRMKVRERVRMFRSWAVDAPMVVGWIKPVVLVPAAAFAGLSPEALEAVLAHELAHVRRHDYLVNLVQSALEVLLFYHPAVWWVSTQIRQERELCCDDAAVTLCGDPVLYARALTDLEQLRRPFTPDPQLALAAHGGNLMHRISRLIAPTLPPSPTRRAGLFAALAVTALGAGTAMHFNEDAPKAPAAPAQEKREVAVDAKKPRVNRQVEVKGEVKIQPDAGHDLVLGPGGSIEITERSEGQRRTFKAWMEGTVEKRLYVVNDKEQPVDAAWLKQALDAMKVHTRTESKEGQGKRVEVRIRKHGEGDGEERVIHLGGEGGGHRVVRVERHGDGTEVEIEREGGKVERRVFRVHPGKDGDAKMTWTDKDGQRIEKRIYTIDKEGKEGGGKVIVLGDGEGKWRIDAEQVARHARKMAEQHKDMKIDVETIAKDAREMAEHHKEMALQHKDMAIHFKELKGLRIPEMDFNFEFEDGLPGEKRMFIRRGPEGQGDPRKEMEHLKAEMHRLQQRMEHLQERMSHDQSTPPPAPPKPPKAPKPPAPPPPAAKSVPPPPPAPAPKATPAPAPAPAPKAPGTDA